MKGASKVLRAVKEGRMEERQLNTKRENIRAEVGKGGSNAKPVESEHRHWGNQKSSEPVWAVEASVCACVHLCLLYSY